jgi:2-hydroxy-6-oxonona-2,4-dienedioate hydrolase
MGCQVAIEAALRRPERIDRLVLIAPVPDPAARNAFQQVGRLAMGSVFGRPSLTLRVRRDYSRIGSRFFPKFRHMLAYPIEAKLPEIGVPVMLVRRERDAISPQARLEEAATLLRAPPVVVFPIEAMPCSTAALTKSQQRCVLSSPLGSRASYMLPI